MKGNAQESREVCFGRSLAAEMGEGMVLPLQRRGRNWKSNASKSQLFWFFSASTGKDLETIQVGEDSYALWITDLSENH